MVYLSLGLLLLGAVTALNLVLVLAVIRRLRRHEEERKIRSGTYENPKSGPPTGEPLPSFTAVATDGTPVTSDGLVGREAALTFLSTECSVCVTAAGDLPEFARRTGMDAAQIVVVIAGSDDAAAAEMTAPLAGVATVVREESAGPLSTRYAVRATPTTVMVDPDGTVTYAEAGTNPVLDRLPA
ncbi:TlpA family protein disulfide reductase [Streptomyces sp. NPDC017979]|uniref:TlpA family protein disulfide reductase n=1 Tax=Streptomyces sp. NPDC017979 TaxID=3365024 RepID=UPI0037A53E2C